VVEQRCQVFFVGAGPGDPELITVKGQKCIRRADLVFYAGSLVPPEVVACSREKARVLDSSKMDLQQTHALMMETVRAGGVVARVHTGDPSLYGAIKEQMVLLDRDQVAYEVIPGVTAAFATAAAAKISLTLPEKTQTLILTRQGGRTAVPDREGLQTLAQHGSSMAVYLSASDPEGMAEELLAGGYPADTPVVLGYRVGWPDEKILATDLESVADVARSSQIQRQAVFLILPGQREDPVFSKLYNPQFSHGFRKGKE
jgi:precorrin-4/cobalt-precorrin-4 C11-methyltransferase